MATVQQISRRNRAKALVESRIVFWSENSDLDIFEGKTVDPIQKLSIAEQELRNINDKRVVSID